jgi:hypothetical protein
VDDKGNFINYNIDVINPAAIEIGSPCRLRYESIFRGHTIKYFSTLEAYVNIVNN